MRRLLVVLGVLVVVGGAGLGTFALLRSTAPTPIPPDGCTATVGADSVSLDPDQATNASTIVSVALRRGLPLRAATVALATAAQESKLHNLDYGDLDSLGLFQQRTSQGWGSPDKIMDPEYAAGRFYSALVRIKGWQALPLSEAAQRVQHSAYPDAYVKWEDFARTVAASLYGGRAAALTCVFPSGNADVPAAAASQSHLAALVSDLPHDLPVSVRVVRDAPGAASPDGSATVYVSPTVRARDATATTWAAAAWLVARGRTLRLSSVRTTGRAWTPQTGHWSGDPTAAGLTVRLTGT